MQSKDIGNYIVYSDGKVWSKYAKDYVKGDVQYKGYSRAHLKYNGKRAKHYIHRIIAEVFLPNPLNLPEVDHINRIKTDNRVENLRWCTTKQNCNYYHQWKTSLGPSTATGGVFASPRCK